MHSKSGFFDKSVKDNKNPKKKITALITHVTNITQKEKQNKYQ